MIVSFFLSSEFLVFLAVVFITLSTFFSMSESAFLSVNKLRIRFLRNNKHKGALRAGKLLDNKDKLLNVVLIGNNLVNIGVSAILTSLALKYFGAAGVGIATFVATILLLIFGEISPKTLGTLYPEALSFKLAPFISFFSILFYPLVLFFTTVSRLLLAMLGLRLKKTAVSFTEEEIKTLIEVGEEEGVLESREKNMMHRVFSFTDLAAKDIMVPRTEIISLSLQASFTDILELSQKTKLSRFPVFGKDVDDIQGIVYIKDLLAFKNNFYDFTLKKIMRAPLFILETKNMTAVQQLLQEKNQTIAIVLDEYSGIAGLLTQQDIIREIFGTLYDEYDSPTPSVGMPFDENGGVVSGKTRLSKISATLGITMNSDFHETIAGYIMEELDRIPVEGDVIATKGWVFSVDEMANRRIQKVSIRSAE